MEIELDLKPESESIIDKAKQSEAAGASAFMNPEPKTAKKGPGRPKGVKSEKTDNKAQDPKKEEPKKGPHIETKVLCYPIVKGISSAGVMYCGDNRAAMTMDEVDNIAGSMGLLFDKYLPDIMQNYGLEAAFVLAMSQYTLRLYAIKKIKTMEAAKQQEKTKQEARPQGDVNMNGLAPEREAMPL